MYYLLTPDYFPSGSGRWVDKLALTALCAYYGVFPWYVRELTGAKRNFWLGMGMAALTITWLGAVSSGSWSWSAYWPHIGRIVIACIAIYITTGYYQSRDKLSKSLRNSLAIAILAFNLLFVNE